MVYRLNDIQRTKQSESLNNQTKVLNPSNLPSSSIVLASQRSLSSTLHNNPTHPRSGNDVSIRSFLGNSAPSRPFYADSQPTKPLNFSSPSVILHPEHAQNTTITQQLSSQQSQSTSSMNPITVMFE
jgi:hypothetical protein